MADLLDAQGSAKLPASTGPVELFHRRMLVYAVMALLALGVEVGYARMVPKMPALYAALIRAAVWDCVLVGVVVAQLVDLASTPLLVGTDSGHYLPLAVLLYHVLVLAFCAVFDGLSRVGTNRARTLHRSLVCRRVLLELAGGAGGGRLYLGRFCFLVSGAVLWLGLRVLVLVDASANGLACFIVLVLAAYCAAGLAASEVRHTLPGHLVQWLCTGWGAREAVLQGPLKIVGGILLLPFGASVIAAQIWLRTLAFIVWLAVGCPCCRLRRGDNVYDAFERELALPLLQCSFLAYSGALAAFVLVAAQLSGLHRMVVCIAAVYYTGMLLLWAAPAVVQAKVATEETFDASAALGEDGQVHLLHGAPGSGDDVELEETRSKCDELRALLVRERHDHSVEIAQLHAKLLDQDLLLRAADRDRSQAGDSPTKAGEGGPDDAAVGNGNGGAGEDPEPPEGKARAAAEESPTDAKLDLECGGECCEPTDIENASDESQPGGELSGGESPSASGEPAAGP